MPRIRACAVLLAIVSLLPASRLAAQSVSQHPAASVSPRLQETLAPDGLIHLTFALKSARRDRLAAAIAERQDPHSPKYHQWLTPWEVGQQFGATDADIQAVVAYARAQGFTMRAIWPNRLFVSATAPPALVERAFGVTLRGYRRTPQEIAAGHPAVFFATDHAPQLPADLAARLHGVFGLSSRFAMRPAAGSGGATPNFNGAIGPPELAKVYNLDALHALGLNGQGQSIAIYSPAAFHSSDITAFARHYGYTGYQVTIVSINGGTSDTTDDVEPCLDIETIIGQANNAQIVVYECPNDGSLDPFLQMATDNVPIISDSWTGDEKQIYDYKDDKGVYEGRDYMSAFHTIMETMLVQGQGLFNASGDRGAFNAVSGVRSIGFPGNDPAVTTVGGTSLYGDANGNWQSEKGWSGSGGGLSLFFARPPWQTGPGVSNSASTGGRQTPDIAAMADPNAPGYVIYWRGHWNGVGGTSGAAPLWAAANLLINQGGGQRTGSLNPLLYAIGTQLNDAPNLFVFHDMTSGYNGYFSCVSKWDYVTGWGSADFGKLYADLFLPPNLFPYTPGTGATGGTWTAPLMLHTVAGSVTEPTAFTDTTTYYFAAAIANNGPADAVATINSVQIDGVDHPFTLGAYAIGHYYATLQALTTKLTGGRHVLKLIADSNNILTETSKTDNIYTREIMVSGNSPYPASLTLKPTHITGGLPAYGTLTLDGLANADGAVVTLQSSAPQAAIVPANITVAPGTNTLKFRIDTQPVSKAIWVTISATRNGVTKTAVLIVTAATSGGKQPIGDPGPVGPHD